MTIYDLIGLGASYLYAFGLLLSVETIGRRLKWSQSFTRKLIHIGAGLWIWGILALFDHWYIGIIPFATFILLNYIFYRRQLFTAMDNTDSTPGTVYFAISITLLFAGLWRPQATIDRVPIAAAGVMAMTLGDAFASLVGERWGRHTYTLFKHTRSWEGSIAMGIVSLFSIWGTLYGLSASSLSPTSPPLTALQALPLGVIGAGVATLAEACSPAGTDNLSVPLLSALTLLILGA